MNWRRYFWPVVGFAAVIFSLLLLWHELRGISVDDVIQTRVVETGADLLVLGAYSHSWLRQLLFGGVTRTVLRTVPVAAFLSRSVHNDRRQPPLPKPRLSS